MSKQESKRRIAAFFLGAALVLMAVALAGCQGVGVSKPPAGGKGRGVVTVSGTDFLDGAGKPLLLHGINIINKNQPEGYTARIEQPDFAAIHSWGMNCVRLGILWDGLEPQLGRIDEAYLDRIARIVGWAKAEGLYVLIDMHQDLFSVKFSDGAPAWATLDDGKPYTPTAVWSDAYYTSEAVQRALDHFWGNSPGPDGVGLQDHYARVWRRVAERFKDEPAVLGYDLMNEPFPGVDALRTHRAAMTRLAELLHPRLGTTPEQLFALMGTPAGRKQVTEWLGDMDLFRGMLDAGALIMQDFERGRLLPLYTRVRHAIRQVDSRHIIFLEPAMSANLGIPSAITPLVDEDGRRDPQQAYAPHGYDMVTDTEMLGLSSNRRIELIFRRHAETAKRLDMPMLVGEWGAYYENPAAAPAARFVVRQFDALGCGDIYWAYRRTFGQSPLLPALERHPAEAAN
jgi:endoglycosylceramidase